MLVNMDWSEEEIETKRKEIEQREQQQLKTVYKICIVTLKKSHINENGEIEDQLKFYDFKDYKFENNFVCFEKNDGIKRVINTEEIKEFYIKFEDVTK